MMRSTSPPFRFLLDEYVWTSCRAHCDEEAGNPGDIGWVGLALGTGQELVDAGTWARLTPAERRMLAHSHAVVMTEDHYGNCVVEYYGSVAEARAMFASIAHDTGG